MRSGPIFHIFSKSENTYCAHITLIHVNTLPLTDRHLICLCYLRRVVILPNSIPRPSQSLSSLNAERTSVGFQPRKQSDGKWTFYSSSPAPHLCPASKSTEIHRSGLLLIYSSLWVWLRGTSCGFCYWLLWFLMVTFGNIVWFNIYNVQHQLDSSALNRQLY